MAMNDDEPIAREPWQRLLRAGDDGPSELTDARIRAAAHRALAPRPARWWLSASLAASFVLAVLLVQWQFGDDTVPATLHESDIAAPPPASHSVPAAEEARAEPEMPAADAARAADQAIAPAARLRARQEPAVAVPAAPPAAKAELDEFAPAPAPARESESPASAVTNVTVTGGSRRTKEAAPIRSDAANEPLQLGAFAEMPEAARDPAEWYAEIEALRADGRTEEADAELARLEAAWPGWMEKNHPQPR